MSEDTRLCFLRAKIWFRKGLTVGVIAGAFVAFVQVMSILASGENLTKSVIEYVEFCSTCGVINGIIFWLLSFAGWMIEKLVWKARNYYK